VRDRLVGPQEEAVEVRRRASRPLRGGRGDDRHDKESADDPEEAGRTHRL
jgi:hypothetical protein